MPKLSKTPFTARAVGSLIRELQAKAKKDRRAVKAWDSTQRGFGLRVQPSGVAAWIVRTRDKSGKAIEHTIANNAALEMLPLETARDSARDWARSAPTAKSRDKSKLTLGEIIDLTLVHLEATGTRETTLREYRRILSADNDYVADLRPLPALSIERKTIKALHARIAASSPSVAVRVVRLLGQCYRYASIEEELLPAGMNPCTAIKTATTPSRVQSLRPEYYTALGEALQRAATVGLETAPTLRKKAKVHKEKRLAKGGDRGPYKDAGNYQHGANPTPYIRIALLYWLAVTGWRKGEGFALRWKDINLADRIVILPRTKVSTHGGTHTPNPRPVSDIAVAVLNTVRPLREFPSDDTEFVFFPGERMDDKTLLDRRTVLNQREDRRLWANVRHAAGIDIRLHDLRHSFKTMARRVGVNDSELREALMGHSPRKMTDRYGEIPTSELLDAANKTANAIADAMRLPPDISQSAKRANLQIA